MFLRVVQHASGHTRAPGYTHGSTLVLDTRKRERHATTSPTTRFVRCCTPLSEDAGGATGGLEDLLGGAVTELAALVAEEGVRLLLLMLLNGLRLHGLHGGLLEPAHVRLRVVGQGGSLSKVCGVLGQILREAATSAGHGSGGIIPTPEEGEGAATTGGLRYTRGGALHVLGTLVAEQNGVV
jgi:hypothetical protein